MGYLERVKGTELSGYGLTPYQSKLMEQIRKRSELTGNLQYIDAKHLSGDWNVIYPNLLDLQKRQAIVMFEGQFGTTWIKARDE
jgi:hypothetical protein